MSEVNPGFSPGRSSALNPPPTMAGNLSRPPPLPLDPPNPIHFPPLSSSPLSLPLLSPFLLPSLLFLHSPSSSSPPSALLVSPRAPLSSISTVGKTFFLKSLDLKATVQKAQRSKNFEA